MVKKDKSTGKVKIDPLKINPETVQDLTDEEISKIRGGEGGGYSVVGRCTDNNCPTEYANCTVSPRADCLGKSGKICPDTAPKKS